MKQLTEVQMEEICHMARIMDFDVRVQKNQSVLLHRDDAYVIINCVTRVQYTGTYQNKAKHKAPIGFEKPEFYKVIDVVYDTFHRRPNS